MESNLEFNFHEYIQNWEQNLKKQSSFTNSDVEELKNHFLDIIDDLKTRGLDEEEACYVACKRLGGSLEWQEDFKHANNSILQLRKSVLLLSGVISFFFIYHLILFISKLIFGILLISDTEETIALNWIARYLVSIHFLFLVGTVSVYFLEDRTIRLLNKIEFTTKRIIYFLLITFFTGVLNTYAYAFIKSLITETYIKSYLIKYYLYFDYTFPILTSVCFLCLYLRFNKKTNS